MRYVALLRGVSPMNAPNHALRTVFESLKFKDVKSVISSGNILFSSSQTDIKKLETTIENALREQMQLTSPTIIRSIDEIKSIIKRHPFGDMTHSKETYLTVTFLKDVPSVKPSTIKSGDQHFEIISYAPETKIIFAVNDTTRSKTPDFMIKLEKALGKNITTRTWNTVLKIEKKFNY